MTPPRRITRSSLVRFAYTADGQTPSVKSSASDSPDIEDIIPDLSPPRSANTARKRKRTATVTSSTTGSSVKTEAPSAKTRKARLPTRKASDATTGVGAGAVKAPPRWEEMYAAVQEMRKPGGAAYGAAVDTMGCERLASADASPLERRFHTLIALMLSSQTKDTVNAAAMARLKAELPPHAPGAPGGLTLDNILAVEPEVLNELIWAVGFHNNKTK